MKFHEKNLGNIVHNLFSIIDLLHSCSGGSLLIPKGRVYSLISNGPIVVDDNDNDKWYIHGNNDTSSIVVTNITEKNDDDGRKKQKKRIMVGRENILVAYYIEIDMYYVISYILYLSLRRRKSLKKK